MPIDYETSADGSIIITHFRGRMSDEEILASWKLYQESELWHSGMDELVDLSEMDGNDLTTDGIRKFSAYVEGKHQEFGLTRKKIAVYATENVAFGMARMFMMWADMHPELFQVFRSYEEADGWLAASGFKVQ